MQSFLLFITFLAICFYTWETLKLRKINENQLHLQRQPLLILEVRDEGQHGNSFQLKNIGEGVALKIEVLTNELTINDRQVNYPIKFSKIAGLEKGCELGIQSYKVNDVGELIEQLDRLGLSKLSWEAKKVEIEYENLISQKFRTIMRAGRKESILDNFQHQI